jgi:glycosyltransferase involved in cell wall biosynthesis
MTEISVYIIAFNEEEKIADAIASVQWADEIIVADSHSDDRTAEIAESLGARVIQLDFEGFGKLRNDAIAACSHEWIFSLDADERCTPAAAKEIRSIIAEPGASDAYYVPRRNWFMGRWIRRGGWYPDYRQPQLFRKNALLFDDDAVHESYEVHGTVAYMKSDIHQFPFKDLAQLQQKCMRYSTLGVNRLQQRGARASMINALAHGLWAFFRLYVLKLGMLDGWAGFVIALGNFEGVFFRYAKLCEKEKKWNKPPQRP